MLIISHQQNDYEKGNDVPEVAAASAAAGGSTSGSEGSPSLRRSLQNTFASCSSRSGGVTPDRLLRRAFLRSGAPGAEPPCIRGLPTGLSKSSPSSLSVADESSSGFGASSGCGGESSSCAGPRCCCCCCCAWERGREENGQGCEGSKCCERSPRPLRNGRHN